MYRQLEDEKPFSTRRRLAEYGDHMLHLSRDAGHRARKPSTRERSDCSHRKMSQRRSLPVAAVTIPTQLRARLKADGRDLLGTFRSLAPRRDAVCPFRYGRCAAWSSPPPSLLAPRWP